MTTQIAPPPRSQYRGTLSTHIKEVREIPKLEDYWHVCGEEVYELSIADYPESYTGPAVFHYIAVGERDWAAARAYAGAWPKTLADKLRPHMRPKDILAVRMRTCVFTATWGYIPIENGTSDVTFPADNIFE